MSATDTCDDLDGESGHHSNALRCQMDAVPSLPVGMWQSIHSVAATVIPWLQVCIKTLRLPHLFWKEAVSPTWSITLGCKCSSGNWWQAKRQPLLWSLWLDESLLHTELFHLRSMETSGETSHWYGSSSRRIKSKHLLGRKEGERMLNSYSIVKYNMLHTSFYIIITLNCLTLTL